LHALRYGRGGPGKGALGGGGTRLDVSAVRTADTRVPRAPAGDAGAHNPDVLHSGRLPAAPGCRTEADPMILDQSTDGAFRSRLHWGDRTFDDWNCFTTALALRHGGGLLDRPVRERALDFLLRCRHPDGAFGFWPAEGRPALIRERVPSDCDDSA